MPDQNPYSSPHESMAAPDVVTESPPPRFAMSVAIAACAALCGFMLDSANNTLLVLFLLLTDWPLGEWASAIGLSWLWCIVWPHIMAWPMAVAFGVAIGVLAQKKWLVAGLCGGVSFSYGSYLLISPLSLAAQFGMSTVASNMAWNASSVFLVVFVAFLTSRMKHGPNPLET